MVKAQAAVLPKLVVFVKGNGNKSAFINIALVAGGVVIVGKGADFHSQFMVGDGFPLGVQGGIAGNGIVFNIKCFGQFFVGVPAAKRIPGGGGFCNFCKLVASVNSLSFRCSAMAIHFKIDITDIMHRHIFCTTLKRTVVFAEAVPFIFCTSVIYCFKHIRLVGVIHIKSICSNRFHTCRNRKFSQ